MIPFTMLQVLRDNEIIQIHDAALTVLERTGLRIENHELRSVLEAYGAQVDDGSQRVRFPRNLVESFLTDSERYDWTQRTPAVRGEAGIYQGLYLDPLNDSFVPFTENTLAGYIKLARTLPNVTGIHMQNFPLAAGRPTEPLELRIFAWKYGAKDVGSIQLTALCPYLLELYAIRADAEGKSLADVYRGEVFLISPLRFPAHEAEQLMYFRNRGLRVSITNMITAGGTGPVTLAGALTLNLAERLAIGIMNCALYGDRSWSMGGSIAPLDMRTLIQPYGRPEMLLAGLANLQLARYYGVDGQTHGGLTDAKRPSHEAAAQKLLTTLPCIFAGSGNIEPGLLSIDEVFSPIQMILDAEMVGALQRVIRGFTVDAEQLAVDVIDAVGPGGIFTAEVHTARHFREAQWQPSVWSREMLQAWLLGERQIDADYALEIWHATMAQPDPEIGLTPDTEARLLAVVQRARAGLL